VQLVILAAGHGRRFGGLKQLAPVGPDGEAIMDYTAADALAAGFRRVVLIVREEVREELLAHIEKYWPSEIEVVPVLQGPIAGTAQAVASARPAVSGPFAVANADDLYGKAAIELVSRELGELGGGRHVAIGYRLSETVITDAPVTRGVCETDGDGFLLRVVEQTVTREPGGFFGRALEEGPEAPGHHLHGDEVVSMNLWGFDESIFEHLEAALEAFDPSTAPHQPGKPPEVLLPTVVAGVLERGEGKVLVAPTTGRCIGITHPDDLPLVRTLVAEDRLG
jgi:hypothetical protein